MKVSDFTQLVAIREAKKREVNIAQIKEIMRVINDLTSGEFYKLIKVTKK